MNNLNFDQYNAKYSTPKVVRASPGNKLAEIAKEKEKNNLKYQKRHKLSQKDFIVGGV